MIKEAEVKAEAKKDSSIPPPLPLPLPSFSGVPEGNRNNNLARITGAVLRAGSNFDEALAITIAVNSKNQPPLDEKEVFAIVRSIWSLHNG